MLLLIEIARRWDQLLLVVVVDAGQRIGLDGLLVVDLLLVRTLVLVLVLIQAALVLLVILVMEHNQLLIDGVSIM